MDEDNGHDGCEVNKREGGRAADYYTHLECLSPGSETPSSHVEQARQVVG